MLDENGHVVYQYEHHFKDVYHPSFGKAAAIELCTLKTTNTETGHSWTKREVRKKIGVEVADYYRQLAKANRMYGRLADIPYFIETPDAVTDAEKQAVNEYDSTVNSPPSKKTEVSIGDEDLMPGEPS